MNYDEMLTLLKEELGDNFGEEQALEAIKQHPDWVSALKEGEQSAVSDSNKAHMDSTGMLTIPVSKDVIQALSYATL